MTVLGGRLNAQITQHSGPIQNPLPVFPPDGYTAQAGEFIQFSWTPPIPIPPFEPQYQFALFQLLDGQTVAQAIRSNEPFFETYTTTNHVQYPEDLPPLKEGDCFTWTVTTFDPFGTCYCTQTSIPWTFTIAISIVVEDVCGPPQLTIEQGNSVSLGMRVEEAGLFLYPRAVPIQAEGYDWDKIKIECYGCEGYSFKEKAVRDRVISWQWKLIGKGSLGDAFQAQKIQEAQKAVDDLKKQIAEKEARLEEIDTLLSQIPKQKADLEEKIKKADEEIAAIDSALGRLQGRLDSLGQVQAENVETLQDLEQQEEELFEAIDKKLVSIDSLQDILDGKPSEEEMALMDAVDQLEEELESLQDELEQVEEDIVQLGEQFGEQIEQLTDNLEAAVSAYDAVKNDIESKSRQIAALESQLFANPDIRMYYEHRGDWNSKTTLFIVTWLSSQSGTLGTKVGEVKSNAQAVLTTADPALRAQRLATYHTSMSNLIGALTSGCQSLPSPQNCLTALQVVTTSANAFSAVMDTVAASGAMINPTILAQIETLRSTIKSLESSLVDKEAAVEGAQQAYEEAASDFEANLQQLQGNKDQLAEDIGETGDSLTSKQFKLSDKIQARQDTLQKNMGKHLEEMKGFKDALTVFEDSLTGVQDSIVEVIYDTMTCGTQIREVNKQIKEKEEEKAIQQQIKADAEAAIEKLDQEKKDLEAEKDRLEKEIEELKKKLAEKEKELQQQFTGTKTASGEVVYYIPPPLEDDLMDMAEFERLKQEVKKAQDSLTLALTEKEVLQGKLVRGIEGLANALVDYKKNSDLETSLGEEKEEADQEYGQAQTSKKLEVATEKTKAEGEKTELSGDKTELEAELEKAIEDSTKLKDELKKLAEELTKNDSLASLYQLSENAAQIVVETKYKLLDSLQKWNIQIILLQKQPLEAEIKALEEKREHARNDLTRGQALDSTALVASAQVEIGQLEQQIQDKKQQLEPVNNKVKEIQQKMEQLIEELAPAEEEEGEKEKDFAETLKEYNKKRQEYSEKNDEYKEALSRITELKKKLKEIEGELEEVEEQLGEMEDLDSLTNNDDEVKELKEKVEDLEEQIEEAEKKKEAAEAKLEQAGDLKKKEDEADDKIKTAREKLKKAEDDLNKFLHDAFENPKFDPVTILLTAEDEVVDGYRFGDGGTTITNTITYGGRIPNVPTISADASSPAEDAAGGICDVQLDFKKDGEPEVTGVVNNREPRTIALVYKEGEPLWDVWPVIKPEQDKLLAKDVVPVSAAISDDHDEMITQCAPGMFYMIGIPTTPTTPTGTTPTTTTTGTPTYSGTTTTQTYSEGEGCPPSSENGAATSTTTTTTTGTTTAGGHPTTPTTTTTIEVPTTTGIPCYVIPPNVDVLVDLGTFTWEVPRPATTSTRIDHSVIMWEPQLVDKPKKSEPREIKCKYVASEIYPDDEKSNKSLPEVFPGVLTAVKDSIIGVSDTSIKVSGRVIRGDHKGLPQEDVTWIATLKKGESEGYGFGGGRTTLDTMTDGNGLTEVEFDFGHGYAEFELKVQWKRGGEVIEEKTIKARSPLYLQMLRFATAAPDFAWEKAVELYESGEFEESMVEEFPDSQEEEGKYERIVHGVAGLYDHDRKYLNGEKIQFETPTAGVTIKPGEDETELIGIARTVADGIEKDEEATLIARAEEKYRPMCKPEEDKKNFSQGGVDKIRIGSKENPFIVILDEEASEGDIINGTGKLSAEIPGVNNALIAELLGVPLGIHDVELEEGGDVAIAGSVSYTDSELKAMLWGFEITLDSFVVYAYKGAGIGGSVKRDTIGPIKFYAAFDPTGNFLGTISDLPAIGFRGFKLKEGVSLTLDMHLEESEGNLPGNFKGIYIAEAELELPERFKKKKDDDPSTIKVEEFSIGSGGVSGTVSYNGTVFSLAYGGYEFAANEISLGFKNNSITEGSIKGEVKLASPMDGSIEIGVTISNSGFEVELTTEDPVYIPRLSLTFKLLDGCALTYDSEKGIGTLAINATMSQEKLGDMSISGFKASTDGTIEAKSIKGPSNPIEFGTGFKLKVNELSFLVSAEEYMVSIDGEFGFKEILNVAGKVTIKPGPAIEVEKMTLNYEKTPVKFEGSIEYKTDLFKGEFAIGIKMGSGVTKGISGTLVIGNQPVSVDSKEKFSYWYVEIAYAGAPIPLGQSGVALMEVGGGVGYNYSPPIGNEDGAPVNNTPFALKAIVGMGNVPAGQLLAGRMEMVLLPTQFSLYGKVWVLQQKDNIYGEGQINLYWSPEAKVNGYVAMFVGLPDSEGEVFRFNGKVNFSFPSDQGRYVWSEKLNGSFLNSVNATGEILVSEQQLKLAGELTYAKSVSAELAVVTIAASIDVKASGNFTYIVASSTLNASAGFNGTWDVDIKTPLGDADLLSGAVNLQLTLTATPAYIEVAGSANISYDVWVYAGSHNLDVGYRMDL